MKIKKDDFIDDLYGTTLGSLIVSSWILSDKTIKPYKINKKFISLVNKGYFKDVKLSQAKEIVETFELPFKPDSLALVCRSGFALVCPFDGQTVYPLRTDRPANPILIKPDSIDVLEDILNDVPTVVGEDNKQISTVVDKEEADEQN